MGGFALSASEVTIENLAGYYESLAREIMKNHEKRFAERIRAISEASNALGNTANRLSSGVKNAWGEMEKTTAEYGMRLTQTIQETVQPLTQVENTSTFAYSEDYNEKSVQALNKVILTVRKYVPKIPKALKAEMVSLNTALGRLERSVRALGQALDESPGAKITSLRRDVEFLEQKHNESLKWKDEEKKTTLSAETISEREKNLLIEEEALTSRDEFIELRKYEDNLRSKETEIKQFFQPIMKPLAKLERVAASKQASDVDVVVLRSLMESPIETIAKWQSHSILQLMGKLEEALTRGNLDIEERKRRRALETIQQIRGGSVDAMREEFLVGQANIQEALRQLRSTGLLEKRAGLEASLLQIRNEKSDLEKLQSISSERVDDLAKEIQKRKTALEAQLGKLARRSITIRVA